MKGPSITPRPPQGQPIIAALGHASVPYQLIARSAGIGFVTPRDAAHAAEIVAQIRTEQASAGRAAQTVHDRFNRLSDPQNGLASASPARVGQYGQPRGQASRDRG